MASDDEECLIKYDTSREAFAAMEQQVGSHDARYKASVDYWDTQPATYDGVLAGHGQYSSVDIRDSKLMLRKVLRPPGEGQQTRGGQLCTIDCGAGVGRVTQELLLHAFHTVDLLEPSKQLLDQGVKEIMQGIAAGRFPPNHGLGNVLCIGLQEWEPTQGRYDCIWLQWCLLYLTDDDFTALLKKCIPALKPGGFVFVKENIAQEGYLIDQEDLSVTRPDSSMRQLMESSGYQVCYTSKQKGFPQDLQEIRMYIIKPI